MSTRHPVLLRRLFEAGVNTRVNGKAWRLLKNWYEGARCQVRLGEALSEAFESETGFHSVPYTFFLDHGSPVASAASLVEWPKHQQLLCWGMRSADDI